MTPLDTLYIEFLLRASGLSWLTVFDLLLVSGAIYGLLSLASHSRAAVVLRGILVLGLLLAIVIILLPLPTFDWVMQSLLIAMLVATPVIFQPELRRLLDRLGRNVGIAWAGKPQSSESVVPRLARAVENLAATRTGLLVAIEGRESLQDIIQTGIPIEGKISTELIQTIFYKDNPLHDGAVIIRDDVVVAASCVLPLTDRPLPATRRLGTRHRAAVGLSEVSDALILVVSEETGAISTAYQGKLNRPLDHATLLEHLLNFYEQTSPTPEQVSWLNILSSIWHFLWPTPTKSLRHYFVNTATLLLAVMLALITWWFVNEQTNPAQSARFESIPLRVENIPEGTTLVSDAPDTISVLVQTTASVFPTLSNNSFQASVSLENLGAGLHHLPVSINSAADQVLILERNPSTIDIELVPIISRTLTVEIDVVDSQQIATAYELAGQITTDPPSVNITGAQPLLDQVSRIETSISVANASTSLRELRPLQALDEDGREVRGVTIKPAQVQVEVAIRQRLNARNVAVRPVTTGTLENGYWLSGLDVSPDTVTLQGSPSQLVQLSNFINTLPIDISQAGGDFSVQVPLDLPPNVEALDPNGNPIQNVTVTVNLQVRNGYLLLEREVEILGLAVGQSLTLSPPQVDVLISGPIPTLNQIEANPDLIRVILQSNILNQGEDIEVSPALIAPESVDAQLVPSSINVIWPQPTPTPDFPGLAR